MYIRNKYQERFCLICCKIVIEKFPYLGWAAANDNIGFLYVTEINPLKLYKYRVHWNERISIGLFPLLFEITTIIRIEIMMLTKMFIIILILYTLAHIHQLKIIELEEYVFYRDQISPRYCRQLQYNLISILIKFSLAEFILELF